MFVVEGTGIHAEAEVRGADKVLGDVEKAKEVGATRLLLSLEDEGASRELNSMLLQVLDGKHARERSVAVVSTTSSVEVLATNDGVGGSETFIPALHPWLLVEMTVEHHVLGAALGWLDDVDDKRHATLGLEHLLGEALDAKLVNVLVDALH